MSWAALTVAPWCVATALLVSFTAEAGQEPVIGATRIDLTSLAAAMPGDLVPTSAIEGLGFVLPPGTALLAQGGTAAPRDAGAGEMAPRAVPKAGGERLATVESDGRADPAVAVPPTFDAALRASGSLARYRVAAMTFGDADPDERPSDFAPVPVDAPVPEALQLLPLPWNLTTTPRSRSVGASQAATGVAAPHVQDGSTPSVARAETLASTTPAPATPIAISALPKFSRGPNGLVTSDEPVVGVALDHPDYAAMIETARSAPEQRCLAQAVYFEARSEPEEGQAAVAQVVLNRAMSGLYPGSVCGVVFQNQQRRNACQFSFACEGHALRVTEDDAWARAVRIAREVTDGAAYVSDIGASTHYHANYVRPFWARALRKTDVIGHHIFYELRAGQS